MSKHRPIVPARSSSQILLRRHSRRLVDERKASQRPSLVLPLSTAELEEGLATLNGGEVDRLMFWKENIAAYRETLLDAIRQTLLALSSRHLTGHSRAELESQLPALRRYVRLADRQLLVGPVKQQR
ncbi:MAG: hypothetical protein ACJ8EL_15800 [Rhizomicrobium sp.]|jgi:hypothetical protein